MSEAVARWAIERLAKHHDRSAFECGQRSLSDWIRQSAGQFMDRDLSRVYVAISPGQSQVLGYYAISNAHIRHDDLPRPNSKRLPRHIDVPVALIGKLAVDRGVQGQGLGAFLLIDALRRIRLLGRPDGNGCDSCGGTGMVCGRGRGCGLIHHGDGCGDPCRACGGGGCGFCKGLGLLREGCGNPRGPGGIGGPREGNMGGGSLISPQVPAPIPSTQWSPQSTFIAGQCGDPGCLLKNRHFHRIGRGCSTCDGKGCGICRDPGKSCGTICGNCRGRGCGLCGGRGLLPCLNPGAAAHSLLAKLFHRGEIEYFVGPGGPVPLTPGYVPYIVTTRAPRLLCLPALLRPRPLMRNEAPHSCGGTGPPARAVSGGTAFDVSAHFPGNPGAFFFVAPP